MYLQLHPPVQRRRRVRSSLDASSTPPRAIDGVCLEIMEILDQHDPTTRLSRRRLGGHRRRADVASTYATVHRIGRLRRNNDERLTFHDH